MRIVSWNVNSIRARLDRFLNWIEENEPDVLCLQELKTRGEGFPLDELGELGYYAEMHGQKSYNGVALIAREPIEDLKISLADGVDDPQARLISGVIDGIQVVSVYVPNGHFVGSEKWAYKLKWLARLRLWLETHGDPQGRIVVAGDFNVAPTDVDVKNVAQWSDSTLCVPEIRAALAHITDWGLRDAFRVAHPEATGIFSWWDYRDRGFARNDGLRIDQLWVGSGITVEDSGVDREERREVRGSGKPSDHAPTWADVT